MPLKSVKHIKFSRKITERDRNIRKLPEGWIFYARHAETIHKSLACKLAKLAFRGKYMLKRWENAKCRLHK